MSDDVLVIGGGPAGLYAAQLLARGGVRVRVLEEHRRIGEPVHCTGILGTETFALPGIPRDAVVGSPRAARFHSPAGHQVSYEGPEGEACIVDRGVFDRGLASAARDAGAVVMTGVRASGLHVEPRRVTVTATVAERPRVFSAKVCLLACGARYRFQRALGWGTPPLLLSSAQAEVAGTGDGTLDIFLRRELAPMGFAWLVPISRGGEPRMKVGVMADRGPGRILDRLVNELRTAGRVSGPVEPAVVRPLPLAPLSRTYADRLLAIGDAAGLVKPTTGGGIYYGLLSASWAAETVVGALAGGDFSATTLGRYEQTWRGRLGAEITVAMWFRRLVAWLHPSDLDALTELALMDGLIPIVRQTARFNWHRELILRSLRHPEVLRIVFRRLIGSVGEGLDDRLPWGGPETSWA